MPKSCKTRNGKTRQPIYIWDEETQADGHLTVHTATGTKIYFDSKSRNPSIVKWLEDAINGNVESYGLELPDCDY